MSHEFKVVLDGFALDDAQETALRVAIQRVVMDHIATMDLGGDRTAAILPLKGNGATQGIVAVYRRSEEINQAFPSGSDES